MRITTRSIADDVLYLRSRERDAMALLRLGLPEDAILSIRDGTPWRVEDSLVQYRVVHRDEVLWVPSGGTTIVRRYPEDCVALARVDAIPMHGAGRVETWTLLFDDDEAT